MTLGNIHYSEDVLSTIIKEEVIKNINVSSVSISMSEENENYIFNVEVVLNTFTNLLSIANQLQEVVIKTLEESLNLINIKVNIFIKNIELKKIEAE